MSNFCTNCGAPVIAGTQFCPQCGAPVKAQQPNHAYNAQQQPLAYEPDSAQPLRRNGLATAGFVVSLIGLILCWVPVVNGFLVIPGLVMSIIGAFRKPNGKAIAGIIMAGVAILIFIILIASVREYQRMFR